MGALTQSQLKRLTAIHGWTGVVLGLLLYAVVVTGAVAVFGNEIGRWSVGGVRTGAPLEGPIDTKIRHLAAEVDPEYRHSIAIWAGEARDMHVFFHTHEINPETGELDDLGTIYRVDSGTGEVLDRHDGFIWGSPAAWETSALRQFLVDLHVQLYIPEPWGLIVTGILGLAMMVAVVSGILMHRHVFRDLFVAERAGGRLVSVRDRHVLAASWGIPFAFLLAFTGSFFSFAGTIGMPLLASVAFGGDEVAMSDTLFTSPVPEDPTPRPLASLDYIIADSETRAPGPVTYLGIENYGRADARVEVWHDPAEGGMLYVTNAYEGPSRAFLGRKEQLGTAPSWGGALYGLMYPLHFGHFAGVLSKAVWGALGVSMAFVVLSGLRLWLRRRAEDRLWSRFERSVEIIGYGLPIGMLASGWGFYVSRPAADAFFWTPWSFVVGALAALAFGLLTRDGAALGRRYRRTIAILCLGLPVLRMATGGMTWSDALIFGQADVVTVDLLLLVAGGVLLWRGRREIPRFALPGPAE